MLNIGPRADGSVPYEISQRMLEMGKWLEVNGESIYGAEAFDLDKDQHDWGKITCKKSKNNFKLFLHVYNWPLNRKLNLTGISEMPQNIYLLSDKQKSSLLFNQTGPFTEIQLPNLQPDPYVSVVVVEYDKKPSITNGLVSKTVDGGFSLNPQNNLVIVPIQISKKEKNGTIPEHVKIDSKSEFIWTVYIDTPGEKKIDISYSFQQESASSFLTLSAANKKLKHQIHTTGKTVGEPNQDWIIDNFKSFQLGKIEFPDSGVFEIKLELNPGLGDEIKFQWIWVK